MIVNVNFYLSWITTFRNHRDSVLVLVVASPLYNNALPAQFIIHMISHLPDNEESKPVPVIFGDKARREPLFIRFFADLLSCFEEHSSFTTL